MSWLNFKKPPYVDDTEEQRARRTPEELNAMAAEAQDAWDAEMRKFQEAFYELAEELGWWTEQTLGPPDEGGTRTLIDNKAAADAPEYEAQVFGAMAYVLDYLCNGDREKIGRVCEEALSLSEPEEA